MENNTQNNQIRDKGGGYKSLLIYLLIGVILAFGIRTIVEPTVVVGESMEKNLHDGEYMLNLKLAYCLTEPDYGDVVIVDVNDDESMKNVNFMIKRVVGLPGDTIEFKDNKLYRNGILIHEDYIAEPMENVEDMVVELGKNEVFVLGDNRNNSLDSRSIGPISYKDEIRGKVILRLFPFDQSYKNGTFK